MSDTSDSRAPAVNATIPPSSHVEDTAGHESPFVQPKTYLRPETRAMEAKPLSPLDKEQMQGLVSGALQPDVYSRYNRWEGWKRDGSQMEPKANHFGC